MIRAARPLPPRDTLRSARGPGRSRYKHCEGRTLRQSCAGRSRQIQKGPASCPGRSPYPRKWSGLYNYSRATSSTRGQGRNERSKRSSGRSRRSRRSGQSSRSQMQSQLPPSDRSTRFRQSGQSSRFRTRSSCPPSGRSRRSRRSGQSSRSQMQSQLPPLGTSPLSATLVETLATFVTFCSIDARFPVLLLRIWEIVDRRDFRPLQRQDLRHPRYKRSARGSISCAT
jgi:hypothetical protein